MMVFCACRAAGPNARDKVYCFGWLFFFFFGLQSTELSQPPYCRTGELGGKWERTGGGNGTEQECRGVFSFSFFLGGVGEVVEEM